MPVITIDVPAIGLDFPTVLLVVVAIFLYRCVSLLKHGISILTEIRDMQRIAQQRGTQHLPRPTTHAVVNAPKQRAHRPAALAPIAALAPVERFLRDSAQLFAECLLDERDVDVSKFVAACRHFATVLEKAGPFTMLSIRETQSNIQKMEHTYLLDPERFRSMFDMLREEVSSGMHSPGGLLADPSAAIGLLWARRGLLFWVSLFRPHAEAYLEKKRGQKQMKKLAQQQQQQQQQLQQLQQQAPSNGSSNEQASGASTARSPSSLPKVSSQTFSSMDSEESAVAMAADVGGLDERLASEPSAVLRAAAPVAAAAPSCADAAQTGATANGSVIRPLPGRLSPSSPVRGGGEGSGREALAACLDGPLGSVREGVARTASGGSLTDKLSALSPGLSEKLNGARETIMNGVLSPQGYAEALRAYSESIEPFNGWIARNTFTLTARATPDWESFSRKLGPPESIGEDVSLWSTAVEAVLQRMKAMHADLDLEDFRKTI